MLFYLAIDSNGHHHLKGTQADARKIDKEATHLTIPTDKPGLMAFIQDLLTKIDETSARPETGQAEESASEMEPVVPTPPVTVAPAHITPQGIEDWLLNQATQAQIETIFSCLGCRFGETIRAGRNNSAGG